MFDELKAASLLPPNATLPEHALAATSGFVDKLDDPIGNMWDAWSIPVEALPFLAWAVRVPLWDEAWSEPKKRSIIAEAPELNRSKGSVHAMRRFVEIMGGRVVGITLPPEGIYVSEGQTEAERLAWLSRFAEIRIYDRPGGDIVAWDFANQAYLDDGLDESGAFLAAYAPKPKRRAVLIDGAQQAELEVVETRTHHPYGSTHIVEKLFGSGFSEGGFFVDENYLKDVLDIASPVLFLQVKGGVPGTRNGVDARLVSGMAERVVQTGIADDFFLDGIDGAGGYLMRSTADTMIYDSFRLYDAGRSTGRLPSGYCLGDPDVFSLAANHILIDIDARFSIPQNVTILNDGFVSDYMLRDDGKHRQRLFDAVSAANPTSDKTLASTAIHRPVRFSDGLPFGSFKFGQMFNAKEATNA